MGGESVSLYSAPSRIPTFPTLAHHAQIVHEGGTKVYQYIDDMLVGGSDVTKKGRAQTNIITHMESLQLQICREKVQLCFSGVKFILI